MSKSKIEWTDEVWNPMTGCSKISAGCQNCYAEKFAKRMQNNPKANGKYRNGFEVTFHPEELNRNFGRKPKRIFVCSMGDLFHEEVPFEFIDKIFSVINKPIRQTVSEANIRIYRYHTFIILTKRPDRMFEYMTKYHQYNQYTFHNLWLGVTCENQKAADERIPILLKIPAAKRFVSIEPMLGEIKLDFLVESRHEVEDVYCDTVYRDALHGHYKLDWVIAGGESGSHARACNPEWIRKVYEQCKEAGVAFYDKRNVLGMNIQEFPTNDL